MLTHKHVAQIHPLSGYGTEMHKKNLPEWVLYHEHTLSENNCIRTVSQISAHEYVLDHLLCLELNHRINTHNEISPALFVSERNIFLLCSFRFNNSQRQKLYTDWTDTVLCSSLSACDRANVYSDKTTILWGADLIWICSIWFVWKHMIFRIKIRRSTPKPSHQWGVSRLNKNVRMRWY